MADSTAEVPVKVSGHMGAVLSESDSSSNSQDHDDVEVEFEEELAGSPSASIVVIDNNNSVQPAPEVEMHGIMTADLPPTPNGQNVRCALGTTSSAKVANGTTMERQPADNAFGISYKPCGASSKQGYELPAGPAFVDEDEFEQEMGAEFRVVLESFGGSLEAPTSSGMAQSENTSNKIGVDIDDFFDDEGNDCRSKEEQKVSVEEDGGGRSFAPTLKDASAPRPCLLEIVRTSFEFSVNPPLFDLPTITSRGTRGVVGASPTV